MKLFRYALALSLIISGGLLAVTTKNPKHHYSKTKSEHKKMEMKKHEKGLRKHETKTAAKDVTMQSAGYHATPATATQKTEPTMMEKASKWLGLGAAGATATKAIATHKEAVHHIGPHGWHHNFGPGWGDKGWVEGTNEHGHWVFAGYRPNWWKENYPAYWKDVVGPLYRKSAEYQKTLGK